MSDPKRYCLRAACEALLFVSVEPVSVISLAETLGSDETEVLVALEDLAHEYESDNSGLCLKEVAGGWRIFTDPLYRSLIETYVTAWDARRLTAPALETLAIIAYTQPTTRAEIAEIRGVNSESCITSLLEKDLICEKGTQKSPGSPVLYGTTRTFLEKFGLFSLSELPDLASFAADDETRQIILSRLQARNGSDEYVQDEASGGLDSFDAVDKIDFMSLAFDIEDE